LKEKWPLTTAQKIVVVWSKCIKTLFSLVDTVQSKQNSGEDVCGDVWLHWHATQQSDFLEAENTVWPTFLTNIPGMVVIMWAVVQSFFLQKTVPELHYLIHLRWAVLWMEIAVCDSFSGSDAPSQVISTCTQMCVWSLHVVHRTSITIQIMSHCTALQRDPLNHLTPQSLAENHSGIEYQTLYTSGTIYQFLYFMKITIFKLLNIQNIIILLLQLVNHKITFQRKLIITEIHIITTHIRQYIKITQII